MKLLIVHVICFVAFYPNMALSAGSVIAVGEGQSCSPKGPVKELNGQQALADAIKNAGQVAAQHIVHQAGLENSSLGRELGTIYLQAPVRGLQEVGKELFRNSRGLKCIKATVMAEIVPDERYEVNIKRLVGINGPLEVEVVPARKVFTQGDFVAFTVKGNKIFFGSIVYTDAADNIIQIIPNEYQKNTKFEGGTEYRFPNSGEFAMKVEPPFGTERITVYAATVPLNLLGEIVPTGGVNADTNSNDSELSRQGTGGKKKHQVVEYVEKTVTLETRRGE
ncbi:MAG: DUF4384 domain-containing protein [Desulfuromonadaceae bacterium]